MPDHRLLELATSLQRVIVTQDIRFRVLAETWQQNNRPFCGLVFAHQRYVSYGDLVLDLEFMAKSTDPSYCQSRIEQSPL